MCSPMTQEKKIILLLYFFKSENISKNTNISSLIVDYSLNTYCPNQNHEMQAKSPMTT